MPVSLLTRWLAAASGLLVALFVPAVAAKADSNALWNIVHGRCVPNQQQHGDPKPCAVVDLKRGVAGGYAVLKDIKGLTQFLLIPTKRIAGIESGTLLEPHAANYFADAWQERHLVEKALGHAMPRDTLSMAVNSELSRSQNQLHIHIDCVRADVRDALNDKAAKIGWHWTPLDIWLFGHHYSVIRVAGTTLPRQNAFKLLARGVPGAAADMGHYTLVVVGMTFADHRPGFVVLADHADPARGDNAGGEELQDHDCALGR
jgi:CDP-diacylglycerol pyrophosphatase